MYQTIKRWLSKLLRMTPPTIKYVKMNIKYSEEEEQ